MTCSLKKTVSPTGTKSARRKGWQWLTVPVKTKGKFGDLAIYELETDNHSRWAVKHWTALRQHYGKAPFFKIYEPQLAEIYGKPWERLDDLMRALTTMLLEALSIRTPLRYSSDMKIDGVKDELVLNLCRAVKQRTISPARWDEIICAKKYLPEPASRCHTMTTGIRRMHRCIRVLSHAWPHPTCCSIAVRTAWQF